VLCLSSFLFRVLVGKVLVLVLVGPVLVLVLVALILVLVLVGPVLVNITEDNLITDGVAGANIFNKYFFSVFTGDGDIAFECRDVRFTPLKVMQVLK